METPVRRASPAKTERQYQPLRTQYQHVSAAAPRVKVVAPPLRELATVPAVERAASIAPTSIAITTSNGAANCTDERNWEAPICPVDAADTFIWNCRWIPDCTHDGSPAEAPLDAPECADAGTQYQPEDEQYQCEVEDRDNEFPEGELSDEDAIDPGEDEPASGSCDEDDADDGSAIPGPSVQPPSGVDSDVTQPTPPTALPSTTAPGVGPQALTGAEPSAPTPEAVPVGERPVAETAPPRRGVSRNSQRSPTAAMDDTGAVLAVATHQEAQRLRDVRPQPVHVRPRVKQTKTSRTVSGPRVDLLASPEPASESAATTETGVWILVFAMLLFALGLLGLAYAGWTASLEQVLLARLGSRLRSKGLSRSSAGVAGTPAERGEENPTGIRYRD